MIDRIIRRLGSGLDMLDWYDNAKQQILNVCQKTGWNFSDVCDVYALCSVRRKDDEACKLTIEYMKNKCLPNRGNSVVGGLTDKFRSSFLYWQTKKKIKGIKTSNFASALKGDKTSVPVDRWLMRAFDLDRFPSTSANQNKIIEFVQKLSEKEFEYAPCEIQAALWAGMKREYGEIPQYSCFEKVYLEENNNDF